MKRSKLIVGTLALLVCAVTAFAARYEQLTVQELTIGSGGKILSADSSSPNVITNAELNACTIDVGTLTNAIQATGSTITGAKVSGGIVTNAELNACTIDVGTFTNAIQATGSTLTGPTVSSGTVSGGVVTNASLNACTVKGSVTVESNVGITGVYTQKFDTAGYTNIVAYKYGIVTNITTVGTP